MNALAIDIDAAPPPEMLDGLSPRVLVADDQSDILEALRMLLKGRGFAMTPATSPASVLDALQTDSYDVVLMDLNYARDTTSGREGIDLIDCIHRVDPLLPVIAMTAWSSLDLAIETMRHGVRDFVQKPWQNAHLVATIEEQTRLVRLQRREQAAEQRRAEQLLENRRRLLDHEHEVSEAENTQRLLVPSEMPRIEGCEISAAWRPAHGVGGDLFNIFAAGEAGTALCVADVVGKGLPAALVMSNLHAAIEAIGQEGVDPKAVCHRVNAVMCPRLASGKFVTCFYGVLDAASRTLTYTNAGHPPPIVISADGDVTRLATGGGVLGAFPDWQFDEARITLLPGDRVIIFTDGITEAEDAAGEEFGETRLIDTLRAIRTMPAAALQASAMDAVIAFAGGALHDDATLVVLAVED